MKYFTLNKIFGAYAVVFVAVVSGLVPREVMVPVTALLMFWTALVPLETATLFFVRTIPLFIAIPLTASYDNLNLWRPLALVIFARLIWEMRHQIRIPNLKTHPVTRRLLILLILAGLSLIGAAHPVTGAIRIIYFVNLSMVPIAIYALVRQGRLTTQQVITNIAIPTMIVIGVGYLQLISTYLMDVYQFMRVWGEGIQLRQFGQQWSYIAVHVGNTWLAYYGDQLSLRVFSLFPDSHSFPTFVLLGLPALFTRKRSYLWIPGAYLIAILSGTRGIWAASVPVALLAWFLAWKWQSRDMRRYGYWLLVFFALFIVAWPLFVSPQFLLGKSDLNLLRHRLQSVIDFGETSNALRLQIWKASLVSIAHHPFLGVGIGNFPVVLGQDIRLAKAGSTAHNLYLHVAAEMGIIAALELIILLGDAWLRTLRWFRAADGHTRVYAGALALSLLWVLIYVMTDPIIFDERVFLLFATTLALIWSHDH